MAERFVVAHHPKSAAATEHQTFQKKGLAFAYAMKRLPKDANSGVAVERQVGEPDTSWQPTDTWRFYKDGNVEHSRSN